MPQESDRTTALAALAEAFGTRLLTSDAVREHHSRDEGWFTPVLPDAVLLPRSTEEVVTAVKICATHRLPIVPFGAGTSLEGQIIPIDGGLTIDFSEMNAVTAIQAEDFTATVQPGVTRMQLNRELKDYGLFFSVDPGADASIGGMASTRASGTTTVRYGNMRENVLALTVVTAEGNIVKTAQRARKSAAGYDLTGLFVGAEGTLGLITEITVKLHPVPEAISAAVAPFRDIASAVQAVVTTMAYGVPMARMELVDELSIQAVNQFKKTDYPEQPTLFLEFHGTDKSVTEQAEIVGEICREAGAGDFQWKTREEDRSALWDARHNAARAVMAQRPGTGFLATDVCVPISALPEMIEQSRAEVQALGLYAPIVGHVGDGNFHFGIPVNQDDPEEMAKVKRFTANLARAAIAKDGTCTGEHGIGLGKQAYLPEELGDTAVEMMRSVKHALDPQGIMNPGKLF